MTFRIALLLTASLALAACHAGDGRIDAGMASLIPADAVALAGIHLDALRATPLYRKLAGTKQALRLDEFDRHNIRELLLASDGRNAIAIARGDFSEETSGLRRIDSHLAVAGSDAMVQNLHRGHGPAALLAGAQALPGDPQIWAVTIGWTGFGPDVLRAMPNLQNVNRIFESVEAATLTADLTSGLHAAATGDCRNEQAAASLAQSLRGLATLARMGAARNRPDLQRAFDRLSVAQNGDHVMVRIDLPEDLAETLLR